MYSWSSPLPLSGEDIRLVDHLNILLKGVECGRTEHQFPPFSGELRTEVSKKEEGRAILDIGRVGGEGGEWADIMTSSTSVRDSWISKLDGISLDEVVPLQRNRSITVITDNNTLTGYSDFAE